MRSPGTGQRPSFLGFAAVEIVKVGVGLISPPPVDRVTKAPLTGGRVGIERPKTRRSPRPIKLYSGRAKCSLHRVRRSRRAQHSLKQRAKTYRCIHRIASRPSGECGRRSVSHVVRSAAFCQYAASSIYDPLRQRTTILIYRHSALYLVRWKGWVDLCNLYAGAYSCCCCMNVGIAIFLQIKLSRPTYV